MANKIGLFFGTFNPIHIGHLIIANHFVEFTDLDEIWLVVTPHNPHKKKNTLLEDNHRLTMVRIAVEEYPKLRASNIEFSLKQPNYTVHTLAFLEEKYPKNTFCLIMGEDNLKGLHKWKNYELILEKYPIYVYPRISNSSENSLVSKYKNITQVEAPIVQISATFIRKSIARKINIRPLLAHKVWQYLDEMNFYK